MGEKGNTREKRNAWKYEAGQKAAVQGELSGEASVVPKIIKREEQKPKPPCRSEKFNIGDSVIVYPQKETGIVYARSNYRGEVGVQVKGKKKLINHKRIKLQISASELYPEDYDFSIIFDSVEVRKARHQMARGCYDGIIVIEEGDH
jgi:hypothetical protein